MQTLYKGISLTLLIAFGMKGRSGVGEGVGRGGGGESSVVGPRKQAAKTPILIEYSRYIMVKLFHF